MNEVLKKKHRELLENHGLAGIEKQFAQERELHFEAIKRSWKGNASELIHLIDRARNKVPSFEQIDFFQELYKCLPWPPLRKPIYCGHFLAPVVNAGILEYNEGFLVLVNTHLLMAVDGACLSVILSAPSWTNQKTRINAAFSREETAQHFSEVIQALLGYKSGFKLMQPRLPSELQWASLIIESAMGFIITHEYSHALPGHKTTERTNRSIQQEWEADAKAIELFISHAKANLYAETMEMGAWLAGPPLVLLVGSIFEEKGDWYGKTKDHPPCLERLIEAKKKIETELKDTEGYRVGWNFVSHFVDIAAIAGLLNLDESYTIETDWQ